MIIKTLNRSEAQNAMKEWVLNYPSLPEVEGDYLKIRKDIQEFNQKVRSECPDSIAKKDYYIDAHIGILLYDYLWRVRHAGAVVVALRLQKDLRLVHQTAEGFAVQDAVGIALITGAHIVLRRRLGAGSALGLVGKLRFFAQKLMLAPFKLFADRHEGSSFRYYCYRRT